MMVIPVFESMMQAGFVVCSLIFDIVQFVVSTSEFEGALFWPEPMQVAVHFKNNKLLQTSRFFCTFKPGIKIICT